jgi:hypothetical protein
VLILREKLFGYYYIPVSSYVGNSDEFDVESTFHVTLDLNGEPVGVARL